MEQIDRYERDTLEYLLRTRNDLDQVRQGDRAKALLSYALGAALIFAAVYFLRPVGVMRYLWIAAAALGGIIVAYGAVHEPLRRQYEILHDYIDFERVKRRLGKP